MRIDFDISQLRMTSLEKNINEGSYAVAKC